MDGWTARYRKLFKFAAWPKKGGRYAKPFWDSGFRNGEAKSLIVQN
jgi:hypothetical protein